ncbi:MAG: alanine racemase [Nevskia sp.]|nr:alanine racemase [Nevskia sp.]
MSAPYVPRVIATIDLGAIRHNLACVRERAAPARVMAAIKADAYGHGAVPVARALEATGVDALAVACIEEALALREAYLRAPIVLLEGVLSFAEAQLAVEQGVEVVVHSAWQLDLLQRLPAAAPLRLWFKLDTGMHRLGLPPHAAPALHAAVRSRPSWRFCGWMTHLACADEPDNPMTARQLEAFERALRELPGPRSIANSAGLLAWPQARADWVRPGLMLYGASPLPGKLGAELGLKPAMRLESLLIAVNELAAGETIGYGASYRCPRAMRVGVAAVGYADGLHRALPSGSPVLVRGRRVSLVGRVSMDMISLDLSEVPDARVGDTVQLWGPELPVEEIAARANTIPYELFCGLTRRVHFVYAD